MHTHISADHPPIYTSALTKKLIEDLAAAHGWDTEESEAEAE
jgi:hypothetical protein